ncbi:YheC/YheD family protein [Cohnella sp. JJ-181]|uniref:YheC/YheD family protein n=1 Tax=Cohnella rhizoplanae TaxID=2974897 RepID=UPI0022FFC0E8|nr:YheC/YheD family protein [Cohnella sp. JJ-181]CAI6064775.1 Endospore coat-associated protein YheD [Cohnella sp. JJ-181]
MPIRRISSKWAKTEALLASPELRGLVPDTRPFDKQTVRGMLDDYGMIYVKPVNGTFGQGVIRLGKTAGNDEGYTLQAGEKQQSFTSYEAMYDSLLKLKRPRTYLSQQGIELLKQSGRRFDFRVMVQMSPAGRWETTGIIGRLAHPRRIVTNYHAGGTPLPMETLMKAHLENAGRTSSGYRRQLSKLGVDVASVLGKRFPGLKEIGIDVAVDTSLKPWILEVNTMPDPFIFLRLPDRSVYRRIRRYATAYGRFRRAKRGSSKSKRRSGGKR